MSGIVVFREKHPHIKQLLLGLDDKIIVIITSESGGGGHSSECFVRKVPSGELNYSLKFETDVTTPAVITKNNQYLGLMTLEGTQKALNAYDCKKGHFLFQIALSSMSLLGFSGIHPFPGRASAVIIASTDSSWIVDIETKRIVRGIKRWNGACTNDGKYGLVAPNQGGLEVIELRNGKTVKVLLPPVSEGVFAVTAKFTSTDEHVLYYHSGRQTLRLFRRSDGRRLANYKLAAEATDFRTTHDGLAVAVAGIDGSFVVLCLSDPTKPEAAERLRRLPSRCDEGSLCSMRTHVNFKTVAKLTATASCSKRQSLCEESPESKVCVVS